MDFLSGFSLCRAGKPGGYVEDENFKISFIEVFCNSMKNVISHGFECCYEWEPIMQIMLKATDEFTTVDAFEDKSEGLVESWLSTYEGWGLLSSMLPSNLQSLFISRLHQTKINWRGRNEFNHKSAFEEVVRRYELDGGARLCSLVPQFGVSIDELVEDDSDERSKLVTLHFDAKWKLEVKFKIEKKRHLKNLVDAAAEVVTSKILDEESIDILEIPEELKLILKIRMTDINWTRSHHEAKHYCNLSDDSILF